MGGDVREGSSACDPELLWPDGLATVLAQAAGRALQARRAAGREPAAGLNRSRVKLAHQRAVDADAVAEWMVGQIPPGRYPGAVFGSAHGSAVHLALALGVPWLPASFDVPTPEIVAGDRPSAWLANGEQAAHGI